MDLGISGKVALIAAASKGIGFATAKLLADEGCKVSICGRAESNLRSAAEKISPDCHWQVCDVSNLESIEHWIQAAKSELGEPHILITNTGGPPVGPVMEISDEQWQTGIDSTLLNIVRMVRLVAPSMAESGWGRIVHITSLVAREPNDLLPISSTIRSGIEALTKVQSNALAKHGVTVNTVQPGYTLTDRQTHLCSIRAEQNGTSLEQEIEKQANIIPVGRMGKPEEIGSAVAFLCSQQAAFITGTSVLVDGGMVKGI